MWQFMYGSDEMFDDLEQRARRSCVRFADQEMPPGTVPARAAIGFEADEGTGHMRLFVERGLTYNGTNDDVAQWVADGSRTFDDVAELRSWLGSTLRDAYRAAPSPPLPAAGSNDNTLYDTDINLDEVGVKGLRLAMRPGCRMKDLSS